MFVDRYVPNTNQRFILLKKWFVFNLFQLVEGCGKNRWCKKGI